ncbi:carbon-nitrogen hydrolase family protein [Chloroflexota bacterium]
MKVWLVQMQAKVNDKEANLIKILDYINQGVTSGANLIVFPELVLTGYVRANYYELAEPIPGPATDKVANLIRGKHTYVVFGMPEVREGTMYNATPMIGPNGVVAVPRKVYLASFTSPTMLKTTEPERVYFKPSESCVVCDTEFGKIGVLICFDLYFPEVARSLALQGAWLILQPTASPIRKVGEMLESITFLTKTRALENLVYFAWINNCGEQEGVSLMGGTHIMDPVPGKSTVNMLKVASVYDLEKGEHAKEEVVECEIDSGSIFKLRHYYPMLREVRPDILEKLYKIAKQVQFNE